MASLLGLALALLLIATLWVSRALAGPAGEEILLTGERVEQWTREEVRRISVALRWAPVSAATGVVAVAVAIGVTWLAPAQDAAAPLVQVTQSTGQQSCGQLIGVSDRQLILRPAPGPVLIPLTTVTAITPVTACS